MKGRDVWGSLAPYGKVWRTGANETTTINLSADVEVEGQKLAKGKYALFTIPGERVGNHYQQRHCIGVGIATKQPTTCCDYGYAEGFGGIS